MSISMGSAQRLLATSMTWMIQYNEAITCGEGKGHASLPESTRPQRSDLAMPGRSGSAHGWRNKARDITRSCFLPRPGGQSPISTKIQ